MSLFPLKIKRIRGWISVHEYYYKKELHVLADNCTLLMWTDTNTELQALSGQKSKHILHTRKLHELLAQNCCAHWRHIDLILIALCAFLSTMIPRYITITPTNFHWFYLCVKMVFDYLKKNVHIEFLRLEPCNDWVSPACWPVSIWGRWHIVLDKGKWYQTNAPTHTRSLSMSGSKQTNRHPYNISKTVRQRKVRSIIGSPN